MKRGHDDLERRLARIFRMLVDRNPAAIVADGQPVADLQDDLDPRREPGDRLVHAIVDDLGREMMKRARIGPADVHPWPPADGL
jgi:hypothetical protein